MLRTLKPNHWYVVTMSGTVDQEFSDSKAGLLFATSWAVSQAITHRTNYTVGYADDDGSFVAYIVICHPDG